jgi:hypothetical protein
MTRCREQRGQAMVLTVLFITALLGMAALVLDVGHWYRTKRDLQAVADSAALAGAQALPGNTGLAASLAQQYATKNGGPVPTVTFSSTLLPADTIHVSVTRNEPGFFAKVFSINSATIGAKAAAQTGTPGATRYAAPFAIDERHPMLQCKPDACTDPTMLELDKVGPGSFRILNLDGSKGGTGQDILAEWVRRGYDKDMPLADYYSDTGAKFNSSEVKAVMNDAVAEGWELLFPVYRAVDAQGANLTYEVIGWAGFVVTGFKGNGNSGEIEGHFTRFIAQGLLATSPSNSGFGAYVIQLIE